MALSKQVMAKINAQPANGMGRALQYQISGLPVGEHALIAEFPHYGWRILRWNDVWHGNWTGQYESADAALDALREELTAVA
jgi:hypothetical protein